MQSNKPSFSTQHINWQLPSDKKLGIVAATFNQNIVDALLAGAKQALRAHNITESQLQVIRVPGAFELPLVSKKLALNPDIVGVIALGVIIRGGTPHFEYVSSECARGVMTATMVTDIPVSFGVLTTDNEKQALARAGGKHGNKGSEAAVALLEQCQALAAV